MTKKLTIFSTSCREPFFRNQLDVYLQPKVDLIDGEIIGFEAFARWLSPILGQVPPNLFIPVAENTGKIIELEISILTKVMEWQQKIESWVRSCYQVAVNISVNHFFHPTFIRKLKELVAKIRSFTRMFPTRNNRKYWTC